MKLKSHKSYYKSLVLITLVTLLSSCGKSGSQADGLSTHVDEFTAFHPETGLPLKPEDLTEEMLKEDKYVEDASRDEVQSMAIHESDVDLEEAKGIMLLGYTPDGSYNSHLTPQCHHTEVKRMVSSYDGPTSNLAQSLQTWANRCEKELSRNQTNSLSTVLKFANAKYDLFGNTIKNIEIEFDDSSKISALLAMKSGKRPLVIFRSGVYSNGTDGGVTKNFFMHLFEESPFHLLYVANVTGTDYMKTNGAVALGGMDEGKQILKIAEMLSNDPQYKDLIEDIHVAGVSLGSHGVLYSSLYNSFESNSKNKIKSAIALCPVVNLEPTIKSVFKPTIAGIYYSYLTRKVFKEVYNYIPILREYLSPEGSWSQSELYNASTQATLWHYKEKTSKTPLDMMPFAGERIVEMSDFWQFNNFVEYADKVTTPTLIVHSRDDFLVQSVFNSDDLLRKTQNHNSQIGIVEFQNGSHCGLNVATGWATMSSMMRTFILKNSSYKPQEGKSVELALKSPYMKSYHKISSYTFHAQKNNSQVEVDIQYFDRWQTAVGGRKCSMYDPLYAPESCYRNKTEEINLSLLASSNLSVPTTDFETERLTRWLNTHATLRNKNGEVILGNNLWPTTLEIDTKADFQN